MKYAMKRTLLIVSIIMLVAILGYVIMVVINSKGEVIYSTTYYFGFGSSSIKIYENGDVYDDVEIEEPNHKPNYEYLKTLPKEDIDDLINKLKNDSNSESIEDYVIQLVYGVNEFDDFGNY